MTISDMTKHYVKSFRNGPLSSDTRKAYEDLKQYGELLGVDLPKSFFRELLERYQKDPGKYNTISPEELNQDILVQYQSYMQRIQEQYGNIAKKKNQIMNRERRTSFEIL